jgi:DNA-binding transcriptional LysR family regulator
MSAVAEAMFLTPSAVSQQIAQLEEEAGVKLTERQGRGVRLTRAGEVLVSHVERILVVLDEAKSELAQIKKEVSGVLRVAAFSTVASALLPHVINTMHARYPYLELVVDELEPADGLKALGSWRADVAFVDDLSMQLGGKSKSCEQVPVLDDVLYVLLAPGHQLARRSSLSVVDLKNEAWALDSAASFYAEFVLNLCRRAGFEPQVNANGRGFEFVSAMVASGCSVTIMPGLRLVRGVHQLSAVKLRPEVRRKISLAYRKGERSHPAIMAFVEQAARSSAALKLGAR